MFKRMVAGFVVFCACSLSAQEKKVDFRKVDDELQSRNAARLDNGGRIRLALLSDDVFKDRRTFPPDVVDGNVHSRQVMTGAPYRFHIDFVDELPIETINFICSDYATEVCPEKVQVKLSSGKTFPKVLEKKPAQRRRPKPRQALDIGGLKARWVEVTVLSNHPGGVNSKGKRVGWGGIGEIEVITSADLSRYLTLVDYNPDLPQDIRSRPARRDYSAIKATLPETIPLGRRPGIYFSSDGWKKLFEKMRKSQRGKPVLDGVVASAGNYLKQTVTFPDPSIPAQMKDRGDPPARAHDALSKQAGITAYAWRITGKEKYAARVREILIGYAKRYPSQYKEHKGVNGSDTSKVMAQRLSEAMWLIPLIQAYDLAGDARCFTEQDRALIEEDLVRCAIRFINRKKPAASDVAERDRRSPNWRTDPAPKQKRKGALGNWTAFYNMAFIQGGCVLGDRDWIDIGAAGLKYMLENGIGDDGMWGEGAIGYQQFARHAMVGGLETLARKGIDLWSYKNNVFKNLFDSEFAYAYPDGTSPGINDSGRAPVGSGWTAMAFDYAYLRYGDPNYAHTINKTHRQLHHSPACYFPTQIYEPLPEVPVKGQSSLVFDNLGYAILRGTDGGGGTFLLMDYGKHGGVHGHPDKLNLILFADGDELAGEPAVYRYEDERHGNWTRPTIAHWTLSIDEHAQNPTTGRLVCFADVGEVKVMRGQASGAYAGVALDRTVVQFPGYIVDVNRAWGPAEHTVDYPLCFRGALDALKTVEESRLKPMAGVTPGYRHIMAAGPEMVKGSWSAVWERETQKAASGRKRPENRVKVTVPPAQEKTEVWVGTVPGGRHQAVLRRRGRDVQFACVVDPYREYDAVKKVSTIKVKGPVAAHGLTIERTDGGTDIVVVRYDAMDEGNAAASSTFETYTTQALVTILRLDRAGKVISRVDLGGGAKSRGKTQ